MAKIDFSRFSPKSGKYGNLLSTAKIRFATDPFWEGIHFRAPNADFEGEIDGTGPSFARVRRLNRGFGAVQPPAPDFPEGRRFPGTLSRRPISNFAGPSGAETQPMVAGAFPRRAYVYYFRRAAALFLFGGPGRAYIVGKSQGSCDPIADMAPCDLAPEDYSTARRRIGVGRLLIRALIWRSPPCYQIPPSMWSVPWGFPTIRGFRDDRTPFGPRILTA